LELFSKDDVAYICLNQQQLPYGALNNILKRVGFIDVIAIPQTLGSHYLASKKIP
jgi:demethylmenaquinone methyltransferase/2-methoxy-6-polyprenyl-1,4-benzoquinol methylase